MYHGTLATSRAASQASIDRRHVRLAATTPQRELYEGESAEAAFPFPTADAAPGGAAGERQPLLGRQRSEQSRAGSSIRSEGGEGQDKERKHEVWIARGILGVLGACILLPWNSEIVASVYFAARLADSPFKYSFISFLTLTFNLGNLAFLAHANATQLEASFTKRILYSIAVITVISALFLGSTQFETINPSLFFGILILFTLILSAAASYLQNAVVALSAELGPSYLAAILSGQGAVGLALAIIQLVAAYTSMDSAPEAASYTHGQATQSVPPTANVSPYLELPHALAAVAVPSNVRTATFYFYIIIGSYGILAFLSHLVLLRLPLFKKGKLADDAESSSAPKRDPKSDKRPSLRTVERKVRKYGISILVVFAVTLSVFPSVATTVTSYDGALGKTLSQQALFVPIVLIIFAGGDWLGRVLPQVSWLAYKDWRLLMGLSFLRIALVPLVLLCNTALKSGDPVMRSDWAFLVIMLVFSVTSGYFSSLVMLACVEDPELDEPEVDVAATCMAFYLTSGLAIGSLTSFAVRAAICRCSPF